MNIKKVLVVDDEYAIAKLLQLHLEGEGYEVIMVLNAADAYPKIKALKPDVVTLDVMMPEMNGFQIMELLKADPETRDIPVLLISIVEGAQRERGLRMGASAFLGKPIDFEELVGTLKQVEGGTPVHQPKVIMVVDDEPEMSRLTRFALEDQGFRVHVADNGPDGVQMAKTLHPDAIVLDLMMPGMDGFAVLKVLKQDESTADIPVLILTSMMDKAYRERCLTLGAQEYLTKPFNENQLFQAVTAHLRAL